MTQLTLLDPAGIRTETSLDEAQRIVKNGVGNTKGVQCPCCRQLCKVYKRALRADMARWLIWLVREYIETPRWIHVSESRDIQRGGDYAKLLYWEMITRKANDDDAKRTSGMWRPTRKGMDFVRGNLRVPAKALLFDSKFIGWSDETTNITEALGDKFNYSMLMMGVKLTPQMIQSLFPG